MQAIVGPALELTIVFVRKLSHKTKMSKSCLFDPPALISGWLQGYNLGTLWYPFITFWISVLPYEQNKRQHIFLQRKSTVW